MSNRENVSAGLRRLRAAAALRGLNLSSLAARCGVSDSHLRAIAVGERNPSEALVAALKRELGDAGWAFWRGQREQLPMPSPDRERA